MTEDCRFSIVVPTYNRRDIVLSSVESLVGLQAPWPVELIVVVDGSTDGTAEALADVRTPFPLRVVVQDNNGAASARNAGAAVAAGTYLLFLDDDMSADPGLLVAHERLLSEDADAVLGHIPLHPDSPATFMTQGVARWTERRSRRLRHGDDRLELADLLTGQLSVRADRFRRIGGFDVAVTEGGRFGGEDTDFLYRLLCDGARVRFSGEAVSYQRYVTTPAANVRQWWQAGWADAMLSRRHPGLGADLFRQHEGAGASGSLLRAATYLPEPVTATVRDGLLRLAAREGAGLATAWAFARVRKHAYWSGARANGGIRRDPDTTARILAYHRVDDVHDPATDRWTVAPGQFERQITALLDAGFQFIEVDQLLDHLAGRPLRGRSVLLMFDDGYRDLAETAAPFLRRHGIPAVVCVVTGELGGRSRWDAGHGTSGIPLLDGAGLAALRADGWEFASHSHSHAHLTTLDRTALARELARSRDDLAGLVGVPRLFAYPYGEHDARVRAAVREAGYVAAIGSGGPHAWPSPAHRFALPRFEVLRGMEAARLPELLLRSPGGRRAGVGREIRGALRRLADLGERLRSGQGAALPAHEDTMSGAA